MSRTLMVGETIPKFECFEAFLDAVVKAASFRLHGKGVYGKGICTDTIPSNWQDADFKKTVDDVVDDTHYWDGDF